VFGGYGFVEEYPMARVMRDARVERLYEGTNEINRQVITGYFLKKSILEELPIRESVKKILNGQVEKLPEFSGPLAAEMASLEIAKRLGLLVFHYALVKYGQDVMTQQQIGEMLSNVFTDIYAMDSVVSRVNQGLKENTEDGIRVQIAKTFCAEKLLDLSAAAEKIIYGTVSGKELPKALAHLKALKEKMILPYDIFRMKSEITEYLYTGGEYPF
jgi:butyryl-CoA dehydrogenase